MKQDTFANRLNKAMNMAGFKQVDLVNKTKIDKTLINKYLNGVTEAKQDKLEILANALGVNEVWLMGYDVNSSTGEKPNFDEYEVLFEKYKELGEADKELIINIIETRKKQIDK